MKRLFKGCFIAQTKSLVSVGGLLLAITLTVCLSNTADAADFLEIAVVTHQESDVSTLSQKELSRLFLSMTNTVSKTKVKAVNLANDALKMSFLERLSGMSTADIEDHFVQVELRGEGKWPPQVDDAGELVRLIVSSKKIIGWMPVEDLENLSERHQSVLKVLSVDGRKPGEDGYLFKE